MLCLKINRGEKVRLFAGNHEIGFVAFDRPDGHSQNAIRMLFDFAPDVKILRESIIERDADLRANLTYRNE